MSKEQQTNEVQIEHEITRFRQSAKAQGHNFDITAFIQAYCDFAKNNTLFRIGNDDNQIKVFGLNAREGKHSGSASNRNEEILCQAMFNTSFKNKTYSITGYGQYIVDYQTPMKNVSDDAKWGKIDLVGLITKSSQKELCFWEVKMGYNQDPLIFAIAELLVYFAQFDFKRNPQANSNYRHLILEIFLMRNRIKNNIITIKNVLPVLFIAGEKAYFDTQKFSDHRQKYRELQHEFMKQLQVNLQFVQLEASPTYSKSHKKHFLEEPPIFTVL